jgi:hypothetical protein
LFQIIFKNKLKTGVFVTGLLFGLFQYGILYQALESLYYEGLWPLKNIHRYLIIFYLIVLSIFFWFTKKTKHDFIKINLFLNLLIFLLFAFNITKINFTSQKKIRKELKEEHGISHSIVFDKQSRLPDIYYIILDGYASNLTLKKYFDFDNTPFTHTLKSLNFSFCDSAFSNYYYTAESLSATLNLDYLNDSLAKNDLIRDNLLFKTLINNSYKTYHLYSGYAVTSSFASADSTIYIDGPNEFEKSILKYTILRLDDLIGLFAHQRLSSQFVKMYELEKIRSKPKFCFLHFVAPHPPYIFDRDGNIRTKHQFAEHSWEPKNFYIDQLVYVNKQITGLVRTILKNNANATIIIQSDHGPWISETTPEEIFEARAHILYAYHAPNKLKIPGKTSSVNTFRYLFNALFNCSLDTLSDSFAGKADLLKDPILTKKVN